MSPAAHVQFQLLCVGWAFTTFSYRFRDHITFALRRQRHLLQCESSDSGVKQTAKNPDYPARPLSHNRDNRSSQLNKPKCMHSGPVRSPLLGPWSFMVPYFVGRFVPRGFLDLVPYEVHGVPCGPVFRREVRSSWLPLFGPL